MQQRTKMVVSGWGTTQNANESNEVLRAAVVPTVNQLRCNIQYKGGITQRMLCAGYAEGGIDSCQGLWFISVLLLSQDDKCWLLTHRTLVTGDSGGPLIYEGSGNAVLYGVVSFGAGCGQPNYAGVYARVAAPLIRSWIKTETEI